MKNEEKSAVVASSEKRRSAPMKLKLVFTIVERGKLEFYADMLQNFEVNAQFFIAAKGTHIGNKVDVIGLADEDKGVIVSVIRSDRAKAAMEMLDEKFTTVKNGKGIAFTVPMSSTIGVAMYQFLCNAEK